MIEIRGPIWNGGKPHIGIADFRIGNGKVTAKITYRRKDGTQSYPGYYTMDGNKLRTYPTQKVGAGVILHVAPLSDWEHHSPANIVEVPEPEPEEVLPQQEKLL